MSARTFFFIGFFFSSWHVQYQMYYSPGARVQSEESQIMNNPGNTWDQVFQKKQCFNHQQRATTHQAPTDLRCCPGVQGASAAWDSDVCLIFPLVPVGLQTFHLKTTCNITTLKEEPAERDPGHDHQGTARDCPPTGWLCGCYSSRPNFCHPPFCSSP